MIISSIDLCCPPCHVLDAIYVRQHHLWLVNQLLLSDDEWWWVKRKKRWEGQWCHCSPGQVFFLYSFPFCFYLCVCCWCVHVCVCKCLNVISTIGISLVACFMWNYKRFLKLMAVSDALLHLKENSVLFYVISILFHFMQKCIHRFCLKFALIKALKIFYCLWL